MQLVVVALVALLGAIVWPVIGAVTVAGFLALVTWRPWCWLRARWPGHPELAACVSTAAVVLVVFVPFAITGYLAIEQVWSGVAWLRTQLSTGGLHSLISKLPHPLQPLAAQYGGSAVGLVSHAAEYAPTLLKHVGRYVAETFLAIVTLFYCYWRGPQIVNFVRRLSPLSSEHTGVLVDELDRVARGLFWGNVMTALLHALFAAIGYAIAGVPAVLLLAGLTLFASFIPGIGTAIIWVPLAVSLWFSGAHWNAIFLFVWGCAVVGGLDHLLRPILSRRGTRLPTLLVFLSIYGGLFWFGLKGLMLGPLIGALALSALRIVERERSGGVLLETPGGTTRENKIGNTHDSLRRMAERFWPRATARQVTSASRRLRPD